jgi:hypothetical protein
MKRAGASDCPKCGCNATSLVAAGGNGRPWARFCCDHCGHAFAVHDGPPRVVEYLEKRIPCCPVHGEPMQDNGGKTPAMRYYICKEAGCGLTGKGSVRRVG